MIRLYHSLMDWSEVWALLIPLSIFLWKRNLNFIMRPVLWYVCIALFLNIVQDIIWKFKDEFHFKGIFYNNPFVYNTHSIVRFFMFSIFFLRLQPSRFKSLKIILAVLFLAFIIINFSIYQSFTDFSSLLFGVETALLLLYCLLYYLTLLQQEDYDSYGRLPEFWVVTGLSIYVVINFPIFLFYRTLTVQFENFAIDIWDVHNLSYIIFCLFLAKAFYVSENG